ncbi:hypothetical protein [Alkalihalobacterium elongatum]|uniref:hypothetical protein n=1 Tax=Alkalihalobacterium elongatum TaxID=2675466 RepID=UPI001C1F79F2|nr:hypothetical protein [Alkalihalobacterium elongatum]
MLEFQLALDEQGVDDEIFTFGKVHVLLDQKALEEIGRYLKIDYYENQGYRLINASQTLAYGLRIKNKNS